MRPHTIAEACRRVRDGQPWDRAMGDFLRQFYATPTEDLRAAMLAGEPPRLDARHDALLGGIVGYRFKRWAPSATPSWIGDRRRSLDRPWFPGAGDVPALMEDLTFASPGEFESRDVMMDDEPLRRADQARP